MSFFQKQPASRPDTSQDITTSSRLLKKALAADRRP
jgi:hypothetical protein